MNAFTDDTDPDPDLAKRAGTVAIDLKNELADDKETEKSLKQLQTSALAEIDALTQVFG